MQPSLSPNSLGPRVEFDREHAAAAFEAFALEEGHPPISLPTGQAIEVPVAEPLVTDPETGHSILGLVELPRGNQDGDNGYVAVGFHPDHGYYLAGPDADLAQLDYSKEGHVVTMATKPVDVGSKPGDRATFGRKGIGWDTASGDHYDQTTLSYAMGSLAAEVGPTTSRQHLTFEVKPEGIAITNLSSNFPRFVGRTK